MGRRDEEEGDVSVVLLEGFECWDSHSFGINRSRSTSAGRYVVSFIDKTMYAKGRIAPHAATICYFVVIHECSFLLCTLLAHIQL